MIWTLVALGLLAVGTYVMKSFGPLTAAGRQLPPLARRIAELLPAALLAALVANQTVAHGTAIVADARIIGVAFAAVAVAFRAPFAVVVVVGAVSTAFARAFFGVA